MDNLLQRKKELTKEIHEKLKKSSFSNKEVAKLVTELRKINQLLGLKKAD